VLPTSRIIAVFYISITLLHITSIFLMFYQNIPISLINLIVFCHFKLSIISFLLCCMKLMSIYGLCVLLSVFYTNSDLLKYSRHLKNWFYWQVSNLLVCWKLNNALSFAASINPEMLFAK